MSGVRQLRKRSEAHSEAKTLTYICGLSLIESRPGEARPGIGQAEHRIARSKAQERHLKGELGEEVNFLKIFGCGDVFQLTIIDD